ncbi:MAG: ectonucleotide pyrophosphatase/phosphodiesterase [Rhizomicrobium sp.]|jgi:alkaline phosphatase D
MWLRGAIVGILCSFIGAAPATAAERTVIVVLFDGFSPAELDAAGATPNFDRIKRDGAWSRHLVPAFPTLSMTNHTTFQTGCWPEHHGVMSNTFYDPVKGLFGKDPGIQDADWRTGCDSFWEAAERRHVRAAVLNWVGRWSSSRGALASIITPRESYRKEPGPDEETNQAVKLIEDDSRSHPRLIALYYNIPDEVAHWNGVSGAKTVAAVRQCDAITGRLMAAISSLPPGREATLVIGTDHGMMNVGPMINVGRLMAMYDIHARQATDGATAFLYLDKGESAARVADVLKPYAYAFDVYKKGHFPAYMHLGDGPRVPDVMLVTKPPYWIIGPEVLPSWAKYIGVNTFWPPIFTPVVGGLKATHGYPPSVTAMHGIFFAWGAGIAKGREIPRLDMIDLHPTIMALLGLQPGRPVDGHVVQGVFADSRR